jgi:hypothetical protein
MGNCPEITAGPAAALRGAEGELVSVSIAVDPDRLESLLDALAELPFPVNPQIYHEAATVRVYPDGRRDADPTTIVEFPAYSGRLAAVLDTVVSRGFEPHSVWARNFLSRIHSDCDAGPAPPGAGYTQLLRYPRFPAG